MTTEQKIQDAKRQLAQAEAAEEWTAKLYDAGQVSHRALTAAIEATLNAVAYLAMVEKYAPPMDSTPTTCIETIGGDPESALRLSFQIKVF